MVRSGWNFQISRMASRELRKVRSKIFFFFFFLGAKFFLIFRFIETFWRKQIHNIDLLLTDEVWIGLGLKLASLGADKPPANNT